MHHKRSAAAGVKRLEFVSLLSVAQLNVFLTQFLKSGRFV